MYLIEFLQDSSLHIACVLETQNGKLRILLPNRREQTLQENRVLPWSGPNIPHSDSKDEIIKIINSHLETRKEIAASIETRDIWDMTQGEVEKADIIWLSELLMSQPDVDTVAGIARALLQDKIHFRFAPPKFEIYPSALIEARTKAEEQKKSQERFVDSGMNWFKTLFDCRQANKSLPPCSLDADIQEKLKQLLLTRIADKNFDSKEDETLWRETIKAIPEDSFAPLLLATTWQIIPEHFNYWLERAEYAVSEEWHASYKNEVQELIEKAHNDTSDLLDIPFISIDGEKTKDIDDAFFLERKEDYWEVHLALACPAAFWQFDSPLDKCISQRGTSIYLPEATYHMLPDELGVDVYSLLEACVRPALVVKLHIDFNGEILLCEPIRARVKLAQNLCYAHVERVLNEEENSANLSMFREAHALSQKLLDKRLANNAVIIERPDPQFILEYEENLPSYYENVRVRLEEPHPTPQSQLLVSELMIAVNNAIAIWANERNIPLLHRTQDIALPKEYAGIWSRPEDIARITRSLSSANLEIQARPHVGMGLSMYAPITSPLRRYGDLINEATILHYLETQNPLFSKEVLQNKLFSLSTDLELVSQVQRMRPRYWKLLYCKQQSRKALEEGNDYIWEGIITEEYEHFFSVSLPKEQLFLRAKRHFFPDKTRIGQKILVRLGKINPLRNEIQIIGVEEI